MKLAKSLLIFTLTLLCISCGSKKNECENCNIVVNGKKFNLNDTLKLSISNSDSEEIKSITYYLNNKKIESSIVLGDITLGKKTINAVLNFGETEKTLSTSIEIFNNIIPEIYSFEIVNVYPHDITSYTQGLEFFNGELYESTGQRGQSKLRKINYKTGEVIKNHNLEDQYFGEGLTILNNNLYQLTWQAKKGFIYDINSFERKGTFNYNKSKEGWGLCNDGENIYKSDGTLKIWTLDKTNLKEKSYIEAYTQKGKIPSLNELEWINGKIYANIYQQNGVVIINPKNGGVEGVINFESLKSKVSQHPNLDVLNGIAYNPDTQTIFVTGKNWDKLFEVKILKP